MHPLYQRLRELDWDTFQRLCGQLLAARHPGLGIQYVEGPGGDGGLDVFQGDLEGRPTIWQCKQFPNGLGAKQREKVKASLRAAIKNYKPQNWILVLPIDLDDKQHVWFQKFQKAYAKDLSIGLFQGSEIVRELIHRRALCDAFFPGAVIDSITLRRATKEGDNLKSLQLDELSAETTDEVIARLEEADARFNYQLVYGPNVGAQIASHGPLSPLHLGSVVDERKRIDIFARDLDALKIDPPTFKVQLKQSAAAKVLESIRTGRPSTLNPDEVLGFRSTFDFLLPAENARGWKIALFPSSKLQDRRLKLRFSFSADSESVEYGYVEFAILRGGTEEMEIESVSSNLAFVVNLILPFTRGKAAQFRLTRKFEGSELRAVEKALRLLSCLSHDARVHIHDLESDRPIGIIEAKANAIENFASLHAFIKDAVIIAEHFGINLFIPKQIGEKDFEAVAFFKCLIEGSPLPIETFSAELVKGPTQSSDRTLQDAKFLEVLATMPNMRAAPCVFGISILTGPIAFLASRAQIQEPEVFWKRYLEATAGQSLPIKIAAETIRGILGPYSHEGVFVRPDPSITQAD